VCKYNEFLNIKTIFEKKFLIFKSKELQTLYSSVWRLQIYTNFLIEKIFVKPFNKKPHKICFSLKDKGLGVFKMLFSGILMITIRLFY
jgi:hypothetical protein